MEEKLSFWWSSSGEDLLKQLNVDPEEGLSGHVVDRQRRLFGSNTLEEIKPTGIWELILESLKEPMIVLLLSIALLSLLFGKPVEAGVMVGVVGAYIAVEFINKWKGDRTMARLRELTQPTTKVVRDGHLTELPTADVVVGDIVILTEGGRVPADIRLLESYGLRVSQSALTGESFPVLKVPQRSSVKKPHWLNGSTVSFLEPPFCQERERGLWSLWARRASLAVSHGACRPKGGRRALSKTR